MTKIIVATLTDGTEKRVTKALRTLIRDTYRAAKLQYTQQWRREDMVSRALVDYCVSVGYTSLRECDEEGTTTDWIIRCIVYRR